jgi:hypothetical protein
VSVACKDWILGDDGRVPWRRWRASAPTWSSNHGYSVASRPLAARHSITLQSVLQLNTYAPTRASAVTVPPCPTIVCVAVHASVYDGASPARCGPAPARSVRPPRRCEERVRSVEGAATGR